MPAPFDPTVVVSLDGSRSAEHALPAALRIARSMRAGIELVFVAGSRPLGREPTYPSSEGDWIRRYLVHVKARLRERGVDGVSSVVLPGHAAEALVDHAAGTGAELIVIAAQGLGGFRLRSLSDALVRQVTVPVLLVRPRLGVVPDLEVEPRLRNILIPLDGSEASECVVERAVRLGEPLGAGYTLVRVVACPDAHYPTGPAAPAGLVDGQRRVAWAEVARTAERMRVRGLQVAEEVVVYPDAAAGILLAAGDVGADLIMMSPQARGAVQSPSLGNVARAVLEDSQVPVILWHPEEVAG